MPHDAPPLPPHRFWPDAPARTDARFDDPRGRTVLTARYLPDLDALGRALWLHGDRGAALLGEWQSLIREAVGDVNAFAAPPPRRMTDVDADAELAAAVAARPETLALRLLREADGTPDGFRRDAGHHVLEDAAKVVLSHRAGLAFDLVVHLARFVPSVIAFDPGRPPRLLEPSGPPGDQERHAGACRRARDLSGAPNPYWESPAFRGLAGRDMAVARTAPHLAAILADMASQGHARAFLKSTRTKGGTWVANLEGVDDARKAALAAHLAMGSDHASVANEKGVGDGVIVQGFVPFTHEHRFLVVGHRIVASTASNRDLSVLDAPSRILHPAVARLAKPASVPGAYDRGASVTSGDRGLVAAMGKTARTVVRALRAEGMVPDRYCLDVGLTERGVLPVEVNTLLGCGLYAADWSRVARALAALDDGRPPPASRSRRHGSDLDIVEDALSFLLDTLWDRPPRFMREVGTRLLAMADDQAAVARAGMAARERHAREADMPVDADIGTLLSDLAEIPGTNADRDVAMTGADADD